MNVPYVDDTARYYYLLHNNSPHTTWMFWYEDNDFYLPSYNLYLCVIEHKQYKSKQT